LKNSWGEQWGGLIFDFFHNLDESNVGIRCIPCKSKENEKKIFFGPSTSTGNGLTFLVKHYIRVKIFFFTIETCLVSKDAEFYVEFKNVNLPLCKISPKKIIGEKRYNKKTTFLHFFQILYLKK